MADKDEELLPWINRWKLMRGTSSGRRYATHAQNGFGVMVHHRDDQEITPTAFTAHIFLGFPRSPDGNGWTNSTIIAEAQKRATVLTGETADV